jgi:hypothetical protein
LRDIVLAALAIPFQLIGLKCSGDLILDQKQIRLPLSVRDKNL